MVHEEIELPLNGTHDSIEEILFQHSFVVYYRNFIITDYYLPDDDSVEPLVTLKTRCKRIRYTEPMSKFSNALFDYKGWIHNYDYYECKCNESKILTKGYRKIYTDIKTDYVYKHSMRQHMYFQIQQVEGGKLFVAYDNEDYDGFPLKKQRELLIADVLEFGLPILSTENVNRFELFGRVLSVSEIVKRMEKAKACLLA